MLLAPKCLGPKAGLHFGSIRRPAGQAPGAEARRLLGRHRQASRRAINQIAAGIFQGLVFIQGLTWAAGRLWGNSSRRRVFARRRKKGGQRTGTPKIPCWPSGGGSGCESTESILVGPIDVLLLHLEPIDQGKSALSSFGAFLLVNLLWVQKKRVYPRAQVLGPGRRARAGARALARSMGRAGPGLRVRTEIGPAPGP